MPEKPNRSLVVEKSELGDWILREIFDYHETPRPPVITHYTKEVSDARKAKNAE